MIFPGKQYTQYNDMGLAAAGSDSNATGKRIDGLGGSRPERREIPRRSRPWVFQSSTPVAQNQEEPKP